MQVNLFIPGFLSHLIYSNFIMELSLLEVSFIVLVLFTLIVLFKYSAIHKNNKVLSRQLNEITAIAAKQDRELAANRDDRAKDFKSSIDSMDLTTKLQKPRLKGVHAGNLEIDSFKAPEKYSYVRSLSARGLNPEEIASILSLSTQETQQLVALSMIGSGNN